VRLAEQQNVPHRITAYTLAHIRHTITIVDMLTLVAEQEGSVPLYTTEVHN